MFGKLAYFQIVLAHRHGCCLHRMPGTCHAITTARHGKARSRGRCSHTTSAINATTSEMHGEMIRWHGACVHGSNAEGLCSEASMSVTLRVARMDSAATSSAAARAYISIRGVSKTFIGRNAVVEALSAIDLDVADGEFVSVIGPSGCGKSTLLMLLSGLDRATSGTIRVGGKIINGPMSDLGIVFQQDVLLDWRTALANVLLQAEIRGSDRTTAMRRATELLGMVGLT